MKKKAYSQHNRARNHWAVCKVQKKYEIRIRKGHWVEPFEMRALLWCCSVCATQKSQKFLMRPNPFIHTHTHSKQKWDKSIWNTWTTLRVRDGHFLVGSPQDRRWKKNTRKINAQITPFHFIFFVNIKRKTTSMTTDGHAKGWKMLSGPAATWDALCRRRQRINNNFLEFSAGYMYSHVVHCRMCTFRLFLIFHQNTFLSMVLTFFLFCFRSYFLRLFFHFHSIFVFFVLFEFAFSLQFTHWTGRHGRHRHRYSRRRVEPQPNGIGWFAHRWRKCLFSSFFFLWISFHSFTRFLVLFSGLKSFILWLRGFLFIFFLLFSSFILLWSTCRHRRRLHLLFFFVLVYFSVRILLLVWFGVRRSG